MSDRLTETRQFLASLEGDDHVVAVSNCRFLLDRLDQVTRDKDTWKASSLDWQRIAADRQNQCQELRAQLGLDTFDGVPIVEDEDMDPSAQPLMMSGSDRLTEIRQYLDRTKKPLTAFVDTSLRFLLDRLDQAQTNLDRALELRNETSLRNLELQHRLSQCQADLEQERAGHSVTAHALELAVKTDRLQDAQATRFFQHNQELENRLAEANQIIQNLVAKKHFGRDWQAANEFVCLWCTGDGKASASIQHDQDCTWYEAYLYVKENR